MNQQIIEENYRAARISNAEIRMLFGNWKDRVSDRRRHNKKFEHAERRVRADRRES